MAKTKKKSKKSVRKTKSKTTSKKPSVKKPSSLKPKSPIQPLGDRVLVKPFSTEDNSTKTVAWIIIPETIDKEKPERGTVIAVGEGKYDDGILIPVKVKVGQRVIFSKYGFDEVKIG